ncbi:MAG: ECF transporter S component [Ruminococcaceae bacterium]|nr:ECF transporter S component [Oscillospiraceae bacterium]
MKNTYRSNILKLTLSAMFMAIGLVLPLLTGQIKTIGNMLLPMHIPVMLCGLICGWYYGAAVGFILPILRSVTFGMPELYPSALAMAFELMTYGLAVGVMYSLLPKKNINIYVSLLTSMVVGRAVWGVVYAALLSVSGDALTWKIFISSAFLKAFPGIILQFIIIPALMIFLKKIKLIK